MFQILFVYKKLEKTGISVCFVVKTIKETTGFGIIGKDFQVPHFFLF